MAAAHLRDWHAAGIRDLRLEFVHETPEQVREVIHAHRAYLNGDLSAAQLQAALDEQVDQGTTEGSLFVPNDFGLLDALPILS